MLGGAQKFFLFKIEISFFQNVKLDKLITNYPSCNYPSCTVTELFVLVTFKCNVIFLKGGGAHQNFFCQKSKFLIFQNVKLEKLITNYPTCNYPSCTVTELFGLVTSKCIVIFFGGSSPKIFFV